MWPKPQFPLDMVTFIEKIFNKKLHLLCIESLDSDLGITYTKIIFKTIFLNI